MKENKFGEPKKHRLYSFLKVFSILDGFAVEDPETLIPKRDYDELSLNDKTKCMSCDEVFSLYLREVSRIVNKDTYGHVLKFIILYRDCINKYGLKKKMQIERIQKSQEEIMQEERSGQYYSV
mmetsp:Transcript_17924/g.15829  ORF Transcript_17924/g.15829 Transcript_17924/m.15829 type:complete len:123 (+) Transcript_17924:473-841(+)